jgi:alanine dehydrogenase
MRRTAEARYDHDVPARLQPIRIDTTFYAPRHPLLEKLAVAIEHLGHHSGAKRTIELVVGTDREIGGEHSPERRVGITPINVAQLVQFFREMGLDLTIAVHENAGIYAGWGDGDFVRAGASIIRREEIRFHRNPPDVFHALKEPSRYEADFRGPFLRIGALHSGDYSPDGGFARLVARQDVAIFDGSATGASGKFRIPIRGRMSVFAGEIAADWVVAHMASRGTTGRVVIVGGGKVGASCCRKLSSKSGVSEIVVCETAVNEERLAEVAQELSVVDKVCVVGIRGLDDPALVAAVEGAAAVVFAVFSPGSRAPRVASLEMLQRQVSPKGTVIDVSIDERGAIQDDEADPEWNSERLIPWFEQRLDPIRYQAIPNMPREYPREASAAHGDVVTPYLAVLLYLSALHGGPMAVVDQLRQIAVDTTSADPLEVAPFEVLKALVQDLRNGLAVYPADGRLQIASTMPLADRQAIERLLNQRQAPPSNGEVRS